MNKGNQDREGSFHKFSCFIIGAESLLIQCAEILLQRGHQIYGVISSESTITHWAREKGIDTVYPGPDLAQRLSRYSFDYLFSIANLSIISKEVLALPRKGAINFHDGPLPRYAGLYATSWALINQEKTHGITWHNISDDVDQGDILKQRTVSIAKDETAFTLNAMCYEAAIGSFSELVDELATGQVTRQKQNLAEQTYFSKYKRPDAACTICWNKPADSISALVRSLNFGPYPNPLGLPKIVIGGKVFFVPKIEVLDSISQTAPGTIMAIDENGLRVTTASHEVVLREVVTTSGERLPLAELAKRVGASVGSRMDQLGEEATDRLTVLYGSICRHEGFWRKRLAGLQSIEIPYSDHSKHGSGPVTYSMAPMATPTDVDTLLAKNGNNVSRCDYLTAAFAAYLARVNGNYAFDLAFSHTAMRQELTEFEDFFPSHVPLRVELGPSVSFDEALETMQSQLALIKKHKSYAHDMVLRYPELKPLQALNGQALLSVTIEQLGTMAQYTPVSGSELTFLVSEDGKTCSWVHDESVIDASRVRTMQRQFSTFLRDATTDSSRSLAEISILTEAEHRQIVVEWNDTCLDYPAQLCIHQGFEKQVEKTPDAVAVVFEDQEITYRELNDRANQLAHHLRRLQVGPETRVGIYMERSLEMMVALLGTLKAGGAYVPLDPTYPQERIAFMVQDGSVPVLLTQARLVNELPSHQAKVVQVDADWDTIASEPKDNVDSGVTSENLSYVIYTSGSTGKPKGVMVCHRNVTNFFAGMDQRIPHNPPGAWLAVTSLSFDISVLELFWTLTRGFKVVLNSDRARIQVANEPTSPHANKEITFSLFYFASDEEEEGVADKYRLLMEGAKFADKHGFTAVWSPERHFHAFGGLYPNPSVASAAIAAITEHVQIRAGSCVLPLHDPIRVAEEWSLVDNLSKGRVGISFASGWNPNDFVLRPENHANRKEIMFRDIDVVRRLWRGETISVTGPDGKDVSVRTLPRPIQSELPVWITIAGSPETYRMAGEKGYNVLTHLLGQTVEGLAENLAIYRKAWVDSGHPGRGDVVLMLHTFVGEDDDKVREIVRKPMTNYLRSAVGLVKQAAWTFPTIRERAEANGKNLSDYLESAKLSKEDMEALLAHAFNRYFETSGLFGTPETCLEMVNKLKSIDVDEIACLIDFGVSSETVLKNLKHLNTLKDLSSAPKREDDDYSIAAQIQRHSVTHMQCTPSMAGMLTLDEQGRTALGKLQTFMVGGEAFPVALSRELRESISGSIINMYGPTETTIWSSTYPVNGTDHTIPIGKPIANTEMYILDHRMQPVPVGVQGELFIGGDGVVRGYLDRPELTEERFIHNPFSDKAGARMYRTGDLVRYRPDGNIEFLGRIDHQVKIRGYRIELGEIETVLAQHPVVQKAVVVARSDDPAATEKRLVAYIVPNGRTASASGALRNYLKETLPDYMLPSVFVFLDNLPLTPNGKVDRGSLPSPEQTRPEIEKAYAAPMNSVEEVLAGIWAEILGVERVGTQDNFFELGGDSLLAVRLISQLRDTFRVELPLHTLFDGPTVAGLSQKLTAIEKKPGQTEKIAQVLKRIEKMSVVEAEELIKKRASESRVAQ